MNVNHNLPIVSICGTFIETIVLDDSEVTVKRKSAADRNRDHPLLSFMDGSCNPIATGMPINAKKIRV